MKIIECKTDAEIMAAHHLIQQLYPDIELPENTYLKLVRNMLAKQYRQITIGDQESCLGTAIFLEMVVFDVGGLIYVQDLVVNEQHRGQGLGKKLLDWICTETKRLGYEYISMNAEKADEKAQSYYFKSGYELDAHYFVKKITL